MPSQNSISKYDGARIRAFILVISLLKGGATVAEVVHRRGLEEAEVEEWLFCWKRKMRGRPKEDEVFCARKR